MTYPQRNRLAILGYVKTTLEKAPFSDKSWTRANGDEIWGLNNLWKKQVKDFRFDRWWEMHARGKSTKEEIDWLKQCGCSVYMLKHHEDIPQSIAYPITEAQAFFKVNYWTNSFSYELALAIMEGFKEIHLYGIDMSAIDGHGPPEVRDQRASIEFFLGWAMALGTRVVIPPESDILHTAIMYGYDEHADSFRQKARARRIEYQKLAKTYRESARYYDGAAEELEVIERTWGDAGANEEDR